MPSRHTLFPASADADGVRVEVLPNTKCCIFRAKEREGERGEWRGRESIDVSLSLLVLCCHSQVTAAGQIGRSRQAVTEKQEKRQSCFFSITFTQLTEEYKCRRV